MVNDLSETNEQDTNEFSEGVSETQKKISFGTALTALNTITEQQPDNSFITREDINILSLRLRRSID